MYFVFLSNFKITFFNANNCRLSDAENTLEELAGVITDT